MPPRKKPEATGVEALFGKTVKLIDKYGAQIPHEGILKGISVEWVTIETPSGRTTCLNRDFISGIAEVKETEKN